LGQKEMTDTESGISTNNPTELEWKNKKIKLLRLFAVLAVFPPALFYSINWFFYPPTNPSVRGIFMVYAGYLGSTIGVLIWAFMPAWIYRIAILLLKKNYDRTYELTFLIGGLIFAAYGFYGSQMN
jgi:hypothetical protein